MVVTSAIQLVVAVPVGELVLHDAPVRPVAAAAVGDEQPVLLQPRVEPAGQRQLAAALRHVRAVAAGTAACDAY
jgi:hypothetical protein